jgi:hypothetical protein
MLAIKLLVIPGREPTGPAEGRPDDRLRERTRNPETMNALRVVGLDSGFVAFGHAPE